MKLLIDIPEHIYEHAKESSEDSRDEFDAMRAIANGTQQESRSENPNTCGDAISRQAVFDLPRQTIRNHWGGVVGDVVYVEDIKRLPSVTPQQRKTQMLDESNFDVNQYEMDLQSAYDCGRASTQQRSGRCKDCKYFEYDSVAKVDGIPLIVAHEICKRWGDGCKSKEDGYCFLFEPKMQEVQDE